MRIQRSPGESVEVDWAGDPMVFADPLTGELRQAWVFVAALSYSAYSYVEALPDMTLGSWIDAHVHAFEHFGLITVEGVEAGDLGRRVAPRLRVEVFR